MMHEFLDFWLCSAAELSVAIDNTETPFGRLPWAEPRCPYVSDHKCCLQPLDVRTLLFEEMPESWYNCMGRLQLLPC